MSTTVTTQAEMDAALAAGAETIIIRSPRGVRLTISDSGSSTVEAYDSSTVRASGSSTVEAYGSSTVEASGSSTVEAYGSSTVRASDSSTVRAGRYVAVHLHSQRVTLSGGVVIDMTAIDRADAATWCDLHGVDVLGDGKAIVAKCVDEAFNAGHSHTLTAYRPGTVVEASDWSPRPVCGGGLHFGPTPGAAMDSAWGPLGPDARWVLCEVDLSEAVGVGNKLKARSCRVLHEVDARGNAVPA